MQVIRSGAYGEVMEHTSLTPAVVPEEPAVARTLLEECLAFIADTGMSETYFGRLSCGNSELLKRMRKPGGEPYFQRAHLLSALVVKTWSPGSVAITFR